MTQKTIIQNQQKFSQTANNFFDVLFGEALKLKCGDIELRGFANGPRHQSYHHTTIDAANAAYNLCQSGLDVYFGVNPRVGEAGAKENVHWLTAFHADIDYGKDGHKKESECSTYDDALNAITQFDIKPTWVNHSGGGFHCYWVLKQPARVEDIGIKQIENVNLALTNELKGDRGTQNINRILRVPETFNFKLNGNPREVKVLEPISKKTK